MNVVKTVIGVVGLVCCAGLSAAETPAAQKLSREEKARLNAERIKQVGGIVSRKGEGKALIINAQQKFGEGLIKDRVDRFQYMLKLNLETRPGKWKLNDPIPEDCKAVLYVVDDKSMPMSLFAPEARWGMMNVSQIEGDARFKKAFARAFTFTFGAGVSQYKISPMQTVLKQEDLDALELDEMTVDGVTAVSRHLANLGLTKSQTSSYLRACKEGWAPAPTNDIQKAVWEKVHQLPTKPIKIEFDPKTDTK